MQFDDREAGAVWQIVVAADWAAKHRQAGDRDVDPRNLFVEVGVGKVERLAAIAAIKSLRMVFWRKDVDDIHGRSERLRARIGLYR
jgi:hypothetical protein